MTIDKGFDTAPGACGGRSGSRWRRARTPGAWALGLALGAATLATGALAAAEEATLSAGDGADGDYFGYSVSLSGDWLAVGAPTDQGDRAGAVYTFERGAEDGAWTMRQRLQPSDADPGNIDFGDSVAIDDGRLLVGAPFGGDSGAAYLFERDAAGAWTERKRLVSSDADDDVSGFGKVVALSDDRLAVAERNSVYVFEPATNGTDWIQAAKLVPDDLDELASGFYLYSFGQSLAVDGDRIVVGAELTTNADDVYIPQAYVFERDASGSWNQAAKLSPPGEGFLEINGVSVDLSGERIAVGVDITSDTHVYERGGDGGWESVATLSFSGAGFETMTVALDGDRVVAGGYGYIFGDPGSAIVFERDAAGSWSEIERLQPADSARGDSFGKAVSLDGDTLLVGSIENGSVEGEELPRGPGAAYVFTFASSADADGDGVSDAADRCPATAVPEARVPAGGASEIARFALRGERDGDGTALFTRPRDGASIPIDRSGGCSCEQLLAREFGSLDVDDPGSLLPLMRVLDQWQGGCYTSTVRQRGQG